MTFATFIAFLLGSVFANPAAAAAASGGAGASGGAASGGAASGGAASGGAGGAASGGRKKQRCPPLAVHSPHCSTLTNNKSACNCHMYVDAYTSRDININGNTCKNVLEFICAHDRLWLSELSEPGWTIHAVLHLFAQETSDDSISLQRKNVCEIIRVYAMEKLGCEKLPEITMDDINALAIYYQTFLNAVPSPSPLPSV